MRFVGLDIGMTVKPRSFFISLAIAVAVLFMLAGTGIYWVLSQSSLALLQGGVERIPVTTAFVPKQSPLVISLLVNPERLESFAQLVVQPERRRRSHRELRDLEQSLLAKTGLDYEKEVKPWLGEEITLAVTSLDYDHQAENGIQPGYLLVVHSKDPELSREFLQLSYATAAIAGNSDLVYDQSQGVKLTYRRFRGAMPNSNLFASAVVGEYVLFANHPKVLRQALTSLQAPDLNLDHSAAYQGAVASLKKPRIGLFYANFPALSAWLSQLDRPDAADSNQTLTIAFSLQSQGLVAQTALTGIAAPENGLPLLSLPVSTLAQIPATSLLTASGQDLQGFWQQLQNGIAPNSPFQQLLGRFVESVQGSLGLNLAEDIFAWIQNDYSLALLPGASEDKPDWVFVAQGRPDSSVLAHLNDLAQVQGYNISTLPVLDQAVTAWTTLKTASKNKITTVQAQVRGAYLVQDDQIIFASSLEALSQVLLARQNPLIGSEKFLKAIAALPTTNQGYFYLDWQASESFLAQQFPFLRVVELSLKPFFKNLRSVTLTSEGATGDIRQGAVYFSLGVNN